MRFHLPFVLLALGIAASPAISATRNFGINGFDRVRVEGPYKVKLSNGVAPFATASGSQAALDRIAMDVTGRTLVIHAGRASWGGYPGENSGPVEIRLGTHELSQASLNGSGSLEIDKVKALSFNLAVQGSGFVTIARADVDQLQIDVAGTAGASVGGTSPKLTATIRGIASLDASGLKVKDATLTTDGASSVKADISNSVKINAFGPATIALTGGPACTTKASGSASVSGCR